MLTEAFGNVTSVKVLVIGDFLFDVYTKGKVERISPEAPVPVLLVSEVSELPGGAGNVALNLKALGAETSVIGRIGKDRAGEELKAFLDEEGIDTKGLFVQRDFKTPLKNRFLADGQQLMRTDYEIATPMDAKLEKEIIKYLQEHLIEYDIVAVSDYGKGFLTKKLLEKILTLGKNEGVRVIVDPKGKDFSKYRGAYLIKPNNKEACAAAQMTEEVGIDVVASKIFDLVDTEYLLVTRSDKGMALFSKDKDEPKNFPAVKKEVVDVTGAGDTALAVLAFFLANDLLFDYAITLANIASGLAIEKVGCRAIKLSEIAKSLLEMDPMNKVFWENTNLFFLERALDDNPLILLDLNGYQDISMEVYHLIKEASSRKNEQKLLVHIVPTDSNKDFIELLASMHEIDFIFARKELPVAVLTTI
jgi:rfaE bifunctional protein kinase chain/domain